MIIPSENWKMFKSFFKVHQDLEKTISGLNKATNGIMGKRIYSNDTKKVWKVINVYERGPFLSRYFEVLIEDISTNLKWWSWQRFTYGWKHPRMMVPVKVLEEKIEKGILKVIEFEFEDDSDVTAGWAQKYLGEVMIEFKWPKEPIS